MQSKIIAYGDVSLYTESFGDSKNPAILLIMGATAQGLMWDNDFCESLVENGFFVIRYDHRDTGKSSKFVYNDSPYYLDDLTLDTIRILDGYNIEKAIFCGASMGSFIAQKASIEFPGRVHSLICIMSSSNHLVFVEGFEGRSTTHLGLPGSNPKILEYYQAILDVKASSADEAKRLYTDALHNVMAVPEHMREVRIFEGRILKRLKSRHHIHNHSFALALSKDLHEELFKINQPTLIIHGADDFILPIEHGRSLHSALKHSKYLEIQQMGHCFTSSVFQTIAHAIKNFAKQHQISQ